MLSDAFGDIENDCDLYICTTETNAMMAFFIKHYGCYFAQILMAVYYDNVVAVTKNKEERCEKYKLKDYILTKHKYIELFLKISYNQKCN